MKKILLVVATILLFTSCIEKNEGVKFGKYGYFKFEKMNNNVYVMHGPVMEPSIENEGFMNNPAFIEGKTSLIVVDPGGNYNVGKKVLKAIELVSKKPIVAVFDTHKHGDHWFANKAILEKYPNVKIYAHPNMIKEVKSSEANKWYSILNSLSKNLKGTKPFAFPANEIKDKQTLSIDGQDFVFFHPKIAHTQTDILILHKNSKTLFLGDNVMKGRFGGFDGTSSVAGNKKLLENIIKDKEYKLYVPGHGRSGKRKETVMPFLNYLTIVEKWAKYAYDNDQESYEVKKDLFKDLQANYSTWDAYKTQVPKHLQKAYIELDEE